MDTKTKVVSKLNDHIALMQAVVTKAKADADATTAWIDRDRRPLHVHRAIRDLMEKLDCSEAHAAENLAEAARAKCAAEIRRAEDEIAIARRNLARVEQVKFG